jgi:hypothetical protein
MGGVSLVWKYLKEYYIKLKIFLLKIKKNLIKYKIKKIYPGI